MIERDKDGERITWVVNPTKMKTKREEWEDCRLRRLDPGVPVPNVTGGPW